MTKRFISYLWVPALIVWTLFLQPIWNLNVETIATSQGLNDELDDAAKGVDPSIVPQWFWDWVTFLTGDFLWGAVTVGSLYFMVDFFAWMRRRKVATSEQTKKRQVLSSIFPDAHNLQKHLRAETSATFTGRPPAGSAAIPVGVSSNVRSFFAQLGDFDVHVPKVPREMTVNDALMVLDFLAVALPFIGKSQVAELRFEAKEFVSKLK